MPKKKSKDPNRLSKREKRNLKRLAYKPDITLPFKILPGTKINDELGRSGSIIARQQCSKSKCSGYSVQIIWDDRQNESVCAVRLVKLVDNSYLLLGGTCPIN